MFNEYVETSSVWVKKQCLRQRSMINSYCTTGVHTIYILFYKHIIQGLSNFIFLIHDPMIHIPIIPFSFSKSLTSQMQSVSSRCTNCVVPIIYEYNFAVYEIVESYRMYIMYNRYMNVFCECVLAQ